MQKIQIVSVTQGIKGKLNIRFDTGVEVALYRGEIRKLSTAEGILLLKEDACISESTYQKILQEIVGLRAKKRAMFLLEQRDYSKQQLIDKLLQNGYPHECIELAVSYVEEFHYIDDLRFAKTYIRYHQQKKSRQRLKLDLMKKGVSKEIIEEALEDEFVSDEKRQIKDWIEKRHYDYESSDEKEKRRMYQFLMRRGYRSSDILSILKCPMTES